jgi:hypothetical protein
MAVPVPEDRYTRLSLTAYASLIDFYGWAERACPHEGARGGRRWRSLGAGAGELMDAPSGVAATTRESSVRGRRGRISVRACLISCLEAPLIPNLAMCEALHTPV